jgi:hypothetical protein
MSYKITIEETKAVTKIVGRNWEVVKRVDNTHDYGYTPEIEKTVKETTEIYQQIVDDLDLAAVIIAVNKLQEFAAKKCQITNKE